MPVALFIVVGLGALALAITGMGSASASNVTLAAITTQALYAAESGAQLSAHQLLFNVTEPGVADNKCGEIDGTELTFSAVGLSSCEVRISCERRGGGNAPKPLYAVESVAACGGGDLRAERRIITLLALDRPD